MDVVQDEDQRAKIISNREANMSRGVRLLSAVLLVSAVSCTDGSTAPGPNAGTIGNPALGFDEYGYNEVAGIFQGPADGVDKKLDGKVWGSAVYASDLLVMKWNKDWNRGRDEGWSNPPYNAWTSNEWNGMVPGGSGETWHYKIVWVGDCKSNGALVPIGGYCIWDQFAVLLSHGTAGQHFWDAHALPSGYGAFP